MKRYDYPRLQERKHDEDHFGIRLEDPYAWLRDAKDPEAVDWVRRENEFTDAWFSDKKVGERMAALRAAKPQPALMYISPRHDGYVATVNDEGDYRIVTADAQLGDVRTLMIRDTIKGFLPFRYELCPADGRYAAVMGSFAGDPRLSVLVMTVDDGQVIETIRGVFGFGWSRTKACLYYSDTLTDAGRTDTRCQLFDTAHRTTHLLYRDEHGSIIGETFVSTDGRHVIFALMKDYAHSRFLTYGEQDGRLTFINRQQPLELNYVDTLNGYHYFISRVDDPNGTLVTVPVGKDMDGATVVRPADRMVLEEGFVCQGQVYVLAMDDVCSRLIAVTPAGDRQVELPSATGTCMLAGRGADDVFLRFESFLDKPSLMRLDGGRLFTAVNYGHGCQDGLLVERRTAPSAGDGRPIPYFIVRRADARPNGANPTWIYAYGGYNVAMRPTPYEHVTGMDIAEWVAKGGIYVMGSIRGGSEFGSSWHQDGMLMKKRNCYNDFIGITEQLIGQGWTAPAHVVISGMSNGGLLMSALVTMRPDLFGCVIDSVPHTDMIQFAHDDRGPMYVTEYGDPDAGREMFEYLLSYSPYHNVKAADYPPVYVQTGECDDNVPPYHGKKFAARMQQCNTAASPILLRVLALGSHDRGAGDVYWRTVAEMLTFVDAALGLDR